MSGETDGEQQMPTTHSDSLRKKLVAMMFAAHRSKLTDLSMEVYLAGLGDIPDEALKAAVISCIRSNKFLPTVAEIRSQVVGTSSERALNGWLAVLKATRFGRYRWINFSDPIVNAAVRVMGGWPGLLDRMNTPENEKWVKHEFIKTYETFLGSGVSGEVCKPLEGLSEASIKDGEIGKPRVQRIEVQAVSVVGRLESHETPPNPHGHITG